MIGATTSWTAIYYAAPNRAPESKIRLGVSALSMDMKSESEIAWTGWLDKGGYEVADDITISKNIVQTDEEFSVAFMDPQHSDATWTITDDKGDNVYTGYGHGINVCGLTDTGIYDLQVTDNNGLDERYPGLICVTSPNKGRTPHIETLTIDNKRIDATDTIIEAAQGKDFTFAYQGCEADGYVSRGVDIDDKWIGVNLGELGLSGGVPFSVAAWVKYDDLSHGLNNFITIEDRTKGDWPFNNWGLFWSRIAEDGRLTFGSPDNTWGTRTRYDADGERLFYTYDETRIMPGAWVHVALTFDYRKVDNQRQLRQILYLNGKRQHISAWMDINKTTAERIINDKANGDWSRLDLLESAAKAYGYDTYDPGFTDVRITPTDRDWLAFGGFAQGVNSVKGCLDELQIWNRAMTDDDVIQSMRGIDINDKPEGLLAWWDFDGDPDEDNTFVSITGDCPARARVWSLKYGNCEDEGAGERITVTPHFRPGCPYINTSSYQIETKANWEVDNHPADGNGTDTFGATTVCFADEGYHQVKVSLTNPYGEDSAIFPIVNVSEDAGAAYILKEELEISTDSMGIYLDIRDKGIYKVTIASIDGRILSHKCFDVSTRSLAHVDFGSRGIYIVEVSKNGTPIKSLKALIR